MRNKGMATVTESESVADQLRTQFGKSLGVAALVGAMILGLSGCSKYNEQPNIEIVDNMMDMPSVKAQELDPLYPSKLREPVAGTVPRGFVAYPFARTDADLNASGALKNPLPRSMAVLQRGQTVYNTYCIVCHGKRGEGDGEAVKHGMARPPSFHTDKVRTWPDGKIYHTITVGQNLMNSYASQIRREDRWAIVHYVRALQRANNPTDADMKEMGIKKDGGK